MRKTGKKFLLIIAALVLVLAMFAGCGSTYHFEPLDGYDATSSAAGTPAGIPGCSARTAADTQTAPDSTPYHGATLPRKTSSGLPL